MKTRSENKFCRRMMTIIVIATGAWIAVTVKTTLEDIRDEMAMLRENAEWRTASRKEGDENRLAAEFDFKRLEQLDEIFARGNGSAAEMAEGINLISLLSSYGSRQWAHADPVSGQLNLDPDAREKFYERMCEHAARELALEIMSHERLSGKLPSLLSHTMWRNVGSWFGMDNTAAHNTPILKEMDAEYKKLKPVRKRLKRLSEGDKNALTGKPEESSAERIARTEERHRFFSLRLIRAETELARMDEERGKWKISLPEQNLLQIRQRKEDYLKFAEIKKADLQTQLKVSQVKMLQYASGGTPVQQEAYGKAKKSAENALSELESLDKRIKTAMADFSEQAEAIRKKDGRAACSGRRPE